MAVLAKSGSVTTNDPTGDNEINGANLIRIDFTNAKNAGVTNFDFPVRQYDQR
jgi:hypothetical protein